MNSGLSPPMPRARWLGMLVLVFAHAAPAFAQFEVIAKAQPDEFYTGIGRPYIRFGEQAPDAVGIPRVNQDYIWGMATDGRFIWCGTGGNVAAQAASQITGFSGVSVPPTEYRSPGGIPLRVWEFGASQYPDIPDQLREGLGDWRPPQIWQYDAKLKKMVNRTPNDPRIKTTLGLRSAGQCNGIALLAGPSLYQVGICLFAFDTQTGAYLGSRYIFQYSNIRRWATVDNELYVGVLNTDQTRSRGSVLHWKGNRFNPFNFEVVGELDNESAYLVGHEGRLFAGTWQSISPYAYIQGQQPDIPPLSGIWMSPKIPRGGLNRLYAGRWKKVWSPEKYEPDEAVAYGYSLGAMESFGGHLYFGTLHYPSVGTIAFEIAYGFSPPAPAANAERNPILLRGRNFNNSSPTFELLYGNATEPAFEPDGQGSGSWVATANNMGGAAGLYGARGFGNPEIQYTWSAQVHKGKLYFGMVDTSGSTRIGQVVDGNGSPGIIGADLWAFPQHGSPAVAISLDGCGNPANHGVRNMVSTQYGLFLGMSNSSNLLTNPEGGRPLGGWEFLRLTND